MEALRKKQYGPIYTNKDGKLSIQKQIRLELDDCISSAPADEAEDVLSFWKFNCHKFLNWLGQLGDIYVSLQPLLLQRVFSTANNIVSDRRTNLLIGNVERLVFLKEKMKVIDSLQDIQATSKKFF